MELRELIRHARLAAAEGHEAETQAREAHEAARCAEESARWAEETAAHAVTEAELVVAMLERMDEAGVLETAEGDS